MGLSMITKKEIFKVLKILRGEVHPISEKSQQLISSLLVYRTRGEFDNSFESAVDCLSRAGYEIEGVIYE